jgi:hypothetical protein
LGHNIVLPFLQTGESSGDKKVAGAPGPDDPEKAVHSDRITAGCLGLRETMKAITFILFVLLTGPNFHHNN